MLGVDHDTNILLSTPFPTIPMLGINCWCNVVFMFYVGNKRCCIVLYCIVLYCIVLYCIVLYCIILYCIVLYCIVLSILFASPNVLSFKIRIFTLLMMLLAILVVHLCCYLRLVNFLFADNHCRSSWNYLTFRFVYQRLVFQLLLLALMIPSNFLLIMI